MSDAKDTATPASLMLQFILDAREYPTSLRGMFDKKELALLSLTCRTWAAAARPLVFERITLQSREQARAFLTTLSSSSVTQFGEYIQRIILRDRASSTPQSYLWFYYFFGSRPRILGPEELSLLITPPPQASESCYSFSSRLPTTLPRSITGCDHLYVSQCRIRSFLDFLEFCGVVSAYGTLNCQRLI
jgi:hypothetical protein